MLTAVLAFFNMIPGLSAVVQGVSTAYFNAKVNIIAARAGVTQAVAVEAIQASVRAQEAHTSELQALAGVKPLMWLIIIFALPVAAFETKVIVWDTMLGLGSTLPIHGQVAEWMTTIINWLFGASTTLAVSSVALKAAQNLK